MPTLADADSLFDDHGTHRRVRADTTHATNSLSQGKFHPFHVIENNHSLQKVFITCPFRKLQ
jgi:hypothetical protein